MVSITRKKNTKEQILSKILHKSETACIVTEWIVNIKHTYADTWGFSLTLQCGNIFGDLAGTTTWIKSTELCIFKYVKYSPLLNFKLDTWW